MNLLKAILLSGLAAFLLRSQTDFSRLTFLGLGEKATKPEVYSEEQFLKEFAQHNIFVMAAAEVAARKCSNHQVREMAKKIREVHKDMHVELTLIANEADVSLPTMPSKELKKQFEDFRNLRPGQISEPFLNLVLEERANQKVMISKYLRDNPPERLAGLQEIIDRKQILRTEGVKAVMVSMQQ